MSLIWGKIGKMEKKILWTLLLKSRAAHTYQKIIGVPPHICVYDAVQQNREQVTKAYFEIWATEMAQG